MCLDDNCDRVTSTVAGLGFMKQTMMYIISDRTIA